MKRIKRIISVVLLILVLFVVGYMCKTCSRLSGNITIEELEYTAYYSEDMNTTLIVSQDYEGEYCLDGTNYVLDFVGYEDGVLRFSANEQEYLFTILENGDLFDLTTKKLLIRRVQNES